MKQARLISTLIDRDMHFVYAAFAEFEGKILVKVGRSVTPLKRVRDVSISSPFPIKQAVFSHIGSKKRAATFERMVAAKFVDFRTRGEWYMFKPEDAEIFKIGMRRCFASVASRQLKWALIDMAKLRDEHFSHWKKLRGIETPKVA